MYRFKFLGYHILICISYHVHKDLYKAIQEKVYQQLLG